VGEAESALKTPEEDHRPLIRLGAIVQYGRIEYGDGILSIGIAQFGSENSEPFAN
jgi:hypothetical protein